ncbi:hypothetical protein I6F40_14805 [Pseudoalteromonas sp. SWXJ133]|uniref:hypothetical protein n=1 Tax=unclassified Pseudoalteromonas TaxID=194690 RepID=UPI00140A9071|nr:MULTISPECIES: hypothetical protein [unclassified Pseudoalteromonas]MBH0021607.1 hypothetical protein [Pseudoalteromonas sp. SWXJ133]
MSIDINYELLKTVISGLTLISIIIAYLNYRTSNLKRKEDDKALQDKEILNQAVSSLDWGFETLTEGKYEEVPRASRLNWLTAARHIMRYTKLKNLIKTETYKLICAEQEEYWRHKFYVLLDKKELRKLDYYTNKAQPEWPENIELSSAMVINDFANWSDGTIDPLEAVNVDALIRLGKAFDGKCGIGIQSYHREFEKIKLNNEVTGT